MEYVWLEFKDEALFKRNSSLLCVNLPWPRSTFSPSRSEWREEDRALRMNVKQCAIFWPQITAAAAAAATVKPPIHPQEVSANTEKKKNFFFFPNAVSDKAKYMSRSGICIVYFFVTCLSFWLNSLTLLEHNKWF